MTLNVHSPGKDKTKPVGINPKGALLSVSGALRNVDGVQPDDQRRTSFKWPAPHGNYPWGSLGAALVTTELLRRAGQPSRDWSDGAILRACRWLYDVNGNPPDGDDCWQPSLLSFLYSGTFSAGNQVTGKNMAYTQWTHGGRKAGG